MNDPAQRRTASLYQRARVTRRRELASVLAFAARRRLSRCPRDLPGAGRHEVPDPAGVPRRAADPQTAGAPRLLERLEVTPELLRLKVSRPAGFDYRPGQNVKLGVPGLLRTYSLVSAPHQDHLEFFVELFAGGRLSERLRRARAGDVLALGDRAKGDLRVDADHANQLLIATVTGIAPYVSFLRDHLYRFGDHGSRRFVILHGASFADELGYAGELAGLARRYPATVEYLPTVSRPDDPRNADWRGARGRVGAQMAALIARRDLTPANTAGFACGNPEMVSNVAAELRRRGFATHTEPFD